MKYAYYDQSESSLLTADEAREMNIKNREYARVAAWHATFNAALIGFASVGFATEAAREIADEIHGSIE